MYGGFKVLVVSGCLIATGCVTDTGKLQVRAIPDQATSLRSGPGDVARANGLLALGSVGLALEGFRKALRDQPTNVEAMAGIAACYAAMGRYDLAQTNYEAALSQAPRDPKLLMALADSLEAQGKNSEATDARRDALRITHPSPPNKSSTQSLAAATKPPVPTVDRLAKILVETVEPTVAPSSSVTVRLPPARLAETVRVPLRKADEVAAAPTKLTAQTAGPRLERLSMGEVALVTSSQPIWRPRLASRATLRGATVRWVPIQSALAARPGIQVLNAARSSGLAARARTVLSDRGWRGVRIGDAPEVRASSIVYYPANRWMLGRRLAAQFGIQTLRPRDAGGLVVLLGRDAARLTAVQRRG